MVVGIVRKELLLSGSDDSLEVHLKTTPDGSRGDHYNELDVVNPSLFISIAMPICIL
jgi:hypothetical protein